MKSELQTSATTLADRSGDDRQLQLVAVNDNGKQLLAWFRSLPGDEQAAVMGLVSRAAEKLRH